MMTKILKNQSGDTLTLLGVQVAYESQFDVPPDKWLNLAEDTTIHTLISSGDVVVNDGTQDLAIPLGLSWVKSLSCEARFCTDTTVGGTYHGDVFVNGNITGTSANFEVHGNLTVIGNITASHNITVKGDIMSTGSFSSTGGAALTINGNFKLGSTFTAANSGGDLANITIEGDFHCKGLVTYRSEAGSTPATFTVLGDMRCDSFNASGNASGIDGNNLSVGGDFWGTAFSDSINCSGGAGADGGDITVKGSVYYAAVYSQGGADSSGGGDGGNVDLGGFYGEVFTSINVNGGMSNGTGDGGAGGTVTINGDYCGDEIAASGAQVFFLGTGNGGAGGDITIFGRAECDGPLRVNGGNGNSGNGGNAGNLTLYGPTTMKDGFIANGGTGSSGSNTGGNAATIIFYDAVTIRSHVQAFGGNGVGNGGNGASLTAYGTVTHAHSRSWNFYGGDSSGAAGGDGGDQTFVGTCAFGAMDCSGGNSGSGEAGRGSQIIFQGTAHASSIDIRDGSGIESTATASIYCNSLTSIESLQMTDRDDCYIDGDVASLIRVASLPTKDKIGSSSKETESQSSPEKCLYAPATSTVDIFYSNMDDFTIKYVDSKLQLASRVELNIMLNAFRIAVNGALSKLNMIDGVMDEYEDETGVDTGSSTNEVYDSANDLYSVAPGCEVDYMEYPTDEAAQAAYESSLSGFVDATPGQSYLASSGSNVDYAFDDQYSSTFWQGDWEAFEDQWIRVQFSSPQTIKKITFNSSNWAGNNPKLCWIEASNNGSSWSKINCSSAGGGLTKTGNNFEIGSGYVSMGWALLDNDTSYNYYRLWMDTTWSYDYMQVGNLEMMVESDPIPYPQSESTIKQQGSYSLKVTAAETDSLNQTITKTLEEENKIDLSSYDTLYFYARASRTGTNFQLQIHDSGGTTTTKAVNISSADTWQLVEWDISGVSSANKDDIDELSLKITNADSENTIYIDDWKTELYNMTLISNATTAETQPDNSRLIVFEEDVDSVTVNTDIKGWVSRDGGTTWSQVTLADEGNYTGSQRILSGTVDISGQPSGTSMKYKITTHNYKNMKIHGTGLTWD